jgi:hypothetical protein
LLSLALRERCFFAPGRGASIIGFLAQLGVVVLTQSVARKPFHAKCKIKKTNKIKGFSLNLATFGLAPAEA